MKWAAVGIGAIVMGLLSVSCDKNSVDLPPAAARPSPASSETREQTGCYFPENCYRPAHDFAPPTVQHELLAGRVFVQFTIDPALKKQDFTIACARLTWKKTGQHYAANCQDLTPAQQRALLQLTRPLLEPLPFVWDRADRPGCQQEQWTMPVTFR